MNDKQQKKFEKVMREFKEGTLSSSSGDKIKDRKQALAVAFSESGVMKADMDLDELIEEHKQLIDVLESDSHEDDKKEVKKQKKELEAYKKQKKSEKIEKALSVLGIEDDFIEDDLTENHLLQKSIEFDGKKYNVNVKQ